MPKTTNTSAGCVPAASRPFAADRLRPTAVFMGGAFRRESYQGSVPIFRGRRPGGITRMG